MMNHMSLEMTVVALNGPDDMIEPLRGENREVKHEASGEGVSCVHGSLCSLYPPPLAGK